MIDTDQDTALKKIECTTNFCVNGKRVHQAKCTYPIEKSKLNFDKCPIIQSLTDKNFDIDLPVQVTINVKSLKMPKTLSEAVKICDECKKHCR